MRIKYLPNSRPVKPWARRWMIWIVCFFAMFLPGFVSGIVRAPWFIALNEWERMRDEVLSYKITPPNEADQ